jgi:hypothetical protein
MFSLLEILIRNSDDEKRPAKPTQTPYTAKSNEDKKKN